VIGAMHWHCCQGDI